MMLQFTSGNRARLRADEQSLRRREFALACVEAQKLIRLQNHCGCHLKDVIRAISKSDCMIARKLPGELESSGKVQRQLHDSLRQKYPFRRGR